MGADIAAVIHASTILNFCVIAALIRHPAHGMVRRRTVPVLETGVMAPLTATARRHHLLAALVPAAPAVRNVARLLTWVVPRKAFAVLRYQILATTLQAFVRFQDVTMWVTVAGFQ